MRKSIALDLMVLVGVMTLLAPAWAAAGTSGLDSLVRIQHYQSRRASSCNPNLESNGDARSIEPGATLVLGDLDGPGMITHLWTTVGTDDPFYPRSLVIRIYWDGMDKPSVAAPLGDFFGVGNGLQASFTSLPVINSSDGRARSCYWKMPFLKHAKVTVTNESKKYRTDSFYYQLDWRKYDSLPADVTYFHAQYRQQTPAQHGNYTLLETHGRGHYVGTVYSVLQTEIGWFGEGDDFFYIDGEKKPSLRGTGTEDYFGYAWGFHSFATPYFGVPVWQGYLAGDCVSAYRWHIQDPVTFTKSLKVTFEHKGSIYEYASPMPKFYGQYHERPDWISSVAFWYQTPPVGFDTPIPPIEKRIPPYRVLDASALDIRATPAQLLTKTKSGVAYLPGKPDARIELSFNVKKAGRYKVYAILQYSFLGGMYQPFVDQQAVGPPLDLGSTEDNEKWVSLDLHDFQPGKHTVRFEGRGLSPHARTEIAREYGFGVSKIILLRLEDLAGYQQVLKRLKRERAAKAAKAK